MKIKITAIFIFVFLLISFCACSKEPKNSNQLTKSSVIKQLVVRYDNTRFGDIWINKMATDFEKITPNIKIKLVSDNDINSNISKAFTSDNNIPDVAFMTKTNWQYFVTKGYLSDITDVYQKPISNQSIEQSIEQSLLPEIKNFGKLNNAYYVMPWTSGVSSFIYNVDVFQKYSLNPPTTTKELLDILPILKQDGVVPFVWAGKQKDFWSGIVTGWWAQFEGQSGISQYLSMDNAEQYNQAGRLNALTLFESIIKDKTNSFDGSENMTLNGAASAFFEGKAAMMPAYSWTEYKYAKTSFNAQMMNLPIIDNAATPLSTNFMSGDFICIPSKAKNILLAKAFIEFTSTTKNIEYFTTETGTPRPFSTVIYDTNLNGFEKSNLDIWKTQNKIFMYSSNPIYYNNYLDWPYSGDPYMQIFYGDETAISIIDKNYNYAKEHWNFK